MSDVSIWPSLIYLGLIFAGLGLALAKHGRPRDGYHSFWESLFTLAFVLALLHWGGFFRPLFG